LVDEYKGLKRIAKLKLFMNTAIYLAKVIFTIKKSAAYRSIKNAE